MEEGGEAGHARVLLEDHREQVLAGRGLIDHLIEVGHLALEAVELPGGVAGGEQAGGGEQEERQRGPQPARGAEQERREQREDQRVALVQLPQPADGDGEGEVEQRRPREPERGQRAATHQARGLRLAHARPGQERGGDQERHQAPLVLRPLPDVEQRVGEILERLLDLLELGVHRLRPADRLRPHHRALEEEEQRRGDRGQRPPEAGQPRAQEGDCASWQ